MLQYTSGVSIIACCLRRALLCISYCQRVSVSRSGAPGWMVVLRLLPPLVVATSCERSTGRQC